MNGPSGLAGRDHEEGQVVHERRLHPFTLIQRVVVALPALVFLLLPFFRNPDGAALFNLVLAIIYAALVLPWTVVRYTRFRYVIEPDQIVIKSGVVTVTRRNIPIERVQNVEIEQSLLQRLTGTARVTIYTAGSQSAEGALEVVSLAESHRIRETIRQFQKADAKVSGPGAQLSDPEALGSGLGAHAGATAPEAATSGSAIAGFGADTSHRRSISAGSSSAEPQPPPEPAPLFEMDIRRVLLSGAFRFSPLYIALMFSALQYIEPDPEAMVDWVMRGRWEWLSSTAGQSPWLAGVVIVVLAILLGWLSGIAINLNRYYGFRVEDDGTKLHHRQGLLSRKSGTIPLRKVQALIIRTNPAMRRFGWYRLEVQTMGFDVKEQGYKVAVPFGTLEEVMQAARAIQAGMPGATAGALELPGHFRPVSRLTIRRAFIRYGVAIGLAAGITGFFWTPAFWLLALLPVALGAAILRYLNMGYEVDDRWLFIRQGFLSRYTWLLPLERSQVFYTSASFFQRRLGLASVYVDTAGASPMRAADLVDLPSSEARGLVFGAYERFKQLRRG